jgi:hypothetical protein
VPERLDAVAEGIGDVVQGPGMGIAGRADAAQIEEAHDGAAPAAGSGDSIASIGKPVALRAGEILLDDSFDALLRVNENTSAVLPRSLALGGIPVGIPADAWRHTTGDVRSHTYRRRSTGMVRERHLEPPRRETHVADR